MSKVDFEAGKISMTRLLRERDAAMVEIDLADSTGRQVVQVQVRYDHFVKALMSGTGVCMFKRWEAK